MFSRVFLFFALLAGPALAAAPPLIPTIPDTTRGVTYNITSSTSSVQVPFAVFGDCSDIEVRLNGAVSALPANLWNCTSQSGTPIASLPLPITDMVVNFTPPLTSGQLDITGAWHPRNPSVPTAAGINRREFEQTKGTLVAAQRELFSGMQALGAIPLTSIFSAAPPINFVTINSSTFKCESTAVYGFVGDGTTDNTAAWAAWKGAIGSSSGCLRFPAGVFKFLSAISVTPAMGQSLDLRGVNTELRFVGAHDGLTVTYTTSAVGTMQPTTPTITLDGFRITTDQIVSGTGLHIKGAFAGPIVPATYVSNLNVMGTGEGLGWAKGVDIDELATAFFSKVYVMNGCFVAGSTACTDVGFDVHGSGVTPHSVNVHFNNVEVQRGGYGIKAHGYFEGLSAEASNFVGMNYGVSCKPTVLFPQCDVKDSHINTRVTDIELDAVAQSHITGNLLYASAFTGMPVHSPVVTVANANDTVIFGNIFLDANLSGQPYGINLTAADRTVINGNSMNAMGVALTMDATTNNVSGEGNYLGTSTVADSGTLNNIGYARDDGIYTRDSSTNAILNLDKGAGDYVSQIIGSRAGLKRWTLTLGNNAASDGSDFALCRFTVGGVAVDCPFAVSRATGASKFTIPTQSLTTLLSIPVTLDTVTILDSQDDASIDPAGTLSDLAVVLPSCTAAYDGKLSSFSTTQILTALTVTATAGSVTNAPTTAAAGQAFRWKCRGSNTTWYRK